MMKLGLVKQRDSHKLDKNYLSAYFRTDVPHRVYFSWVMSLNLRLI